MSQVFIKKILESLTELSDINFQKKYWAAQHSGPGVFSFTEAVCQLFNDSGLDIELDKGNKVFSIAIDSNLKILRKKLSLIDDMRFPLEIIEDCKMQEVRELCRMILDQLKSEKL